MSIKKAKKFLFPIGLPRIEEILFLATLLGVIGIGPRLLNQDGDLGRHLTLGYYILSSYTIPTRDLFSHSLYGQPLTPHEWLAQLTFALIHQWAGLNGIVLFVGMVIAITWSLIYRQALTASLLPLTSLMVSLLSFAAASLHFLARPHIFTFLYLAIWFGMLENLRLRRPLPFWQPLLLMLIWVNTHGAFISGFACFMAYWAEFFGEYLKHRKDIPFFRSQLAKFSGLGILLFVTSLINPVGIRLWKTSIEYVTNRYLISHTQEYLPPNFQSLTTWPFLIMILLSLWLAMSQRQPIPMAHRFLGVGWTALALMSARNIPLYALIMTPILSMQIKSFLTGTRWENREKQFISLQTKIRLPIWATIGSLIIICLILTSPWFKERNKFDPNVFPIEATNWIVASSPQGNMMNYFPWGGYLLFRLWPEYRVFIDGQTDFYGEDLTRTYEKILTLDEGWKFWLDKYQINWVIFPQDSRLIMALRQDPGWECLYKDHLATICLRHHTARPQSMEKR